MTLSRFRELLSHRADGISDTDLERLLRSLEMIAEHVLDSRKKTKRVQPGK